MVCIPINKLLCPHVSEITSIPKGEGVCSLISCHQWRAGAARGVRESQSCTSVFSDSTVVPCGILRATTVGRLYTLKIGTCPKPGCLPSFLET